MGDARQIREYFRKHTTLGKRQDDDYADQYLKKDLIDYHTKSKKELQDADSETSKQLAEANIFVSAVGLLAFGDIEKVAEITEYATSADPNNIGHGLIRLEYALKELLPLPAHLLIPKYMLGKENRQRIKDWTQANKHLLVWNEKGGRFQFK
jgi:hypothetical protein